MHRTLLPLTLLASALPLAAEIIRYEGTWTNNTFNTSGPLSFELEDSNSLTTVTVDLDGPVFGEGDPPSFAFDVPLDDAGNGDFSVSGTQIGDVKGSIDGNGDIGITITNIPTGFLSEVEMSGNIDFENRKFAGKYEIFTDLGSFAEGDLEAVGPAPDSPGIAIKAPKKVTTSGNSRTIRARVTGGNQATVLTAKVRKGKARVVVKGSGPYRIRVKRIRSRRVVVVLAVENDPEPPTKHRVRIRKKGRTEEKR